MSIKPVAYLHDDGEAACTLAEKLAGRTKTIGHDGNACWNTETYFNRPLYEIPDTHRVVCAEFLQAIIVCIQLQNTKTAVDALQATIDGKL